MRIKQFEHEKRTFVVIKTRWVECVKCIAFKESTCIKGSIFNVQCNKEKQTKFFVKTILKTELKTTDLIETFCTWRF